MCHLQLYAKEEESLKAVYDSVNTVVTILNSDEKQSPHGRVPYYQPTTGMLLYYLAVWVCLGETRVFVCLLSVSMSSVRSSSGWVRPAFSLWCSLVVLPQVSGCTWAVGQANPFFVMSIVNIIILYNLLGTIMSVKSFFIILI